MATSTVERWRRALQKRRPDSFNLDAEWRMRMELPYMQTVQSVGPLLQLAARDMLPIAVYLAVRVVSWWSLAFLVRVAQSPVAAVAWSGWLLHWTLVVATSDAFGAVIGAYIGAYVIFRSSILWESGIRNLVTDSTRLIDRWKVLLKLFKEFCRCVGHWQPLGAWPFPTDGWELTVMSAYITARGYNPTFVGRMLEGLRIVADGTDDTRIMQPAVYARVVVMRYESFFCSRFLFQQVLLLCRLPWAYRPHLTWAWASRTEPRAVVAAALAWLHQSPSISRLDLTTGLVYYFLFLYRVVSIGWNVPAEIRAVRRKGWLSFCWQRRDAVRHAIASVLYLALLEYLQVSMVMGGMLMLIDLWVRTYGRVFLEASGWLPWSYPEDSQGGSILCTQSRQHWHYTALQAVRRGTVSRTSLCSICREELRSEPGVEPLSAFEVMVDSISPEASSITRLPLREWAMSKSALALTTCGHAFHAACICKAEVTSDAGNLQCPDCRSLYSTAPFVYRPIAPSAAGQGNKDEDEDEDEDDEAEGHGEAYSTLSHLRTATAAIVEMSQRLTTAAARLAEHTQANGAAAQGAGAASAAAPRAGTSSAANGAAAGAGTAAPAASTGRAPSRTGNRGRAAAAASSAVAPAAATAASASASASAPPASGPAAASGRARRRAGSRSAAHAR